MYENKTRNNDDGHANGYGENGLTKDYMRTDEDKNMDDETFGASMNMGLAGITSTPKKQTMKKSPRRNSTGNYMTAWERAPSRNMAFVDLTWDQEQGRSSKRKRPSDSVDPVNRREKTDDKEDVDEDLGRDDKMRNLLRKVIHKMDKASRELSKLIKENPNTKREIKEVGAQIRSLSSTLETEEIQELLRKIGRDTVVENKDVMRATNTIGIQTMEEGELRKHNKMEEIEKAITGKDPATYEKAMGMEWPKEMYKNTVFHERETAWDEGNLLVIIEKGTYMDESEKEQLGRARDLSLILDNRIDYGKIEYRRKTIETTSSRGQVENETIITALIPVINIDGARNLKEAMREVGPFVENYDIQSIKVVTTKASKIKENVLRNVLESMFIEKRMNIQIGKETKKKSLKDGNDQQRPRNGKLVVKAEGKSFVEMVKDLKEKVDPEKEEIKIKYMKKTKNGDLLLEVEGGDEKASKLKETIARDTGRTVESAGREKSIIITDIDATLKAEEVKAQVARELRGLQNSNIKVKYMMRNGNQIAEVVLPKRYGETMIDRGELSWVGSAAG